MITLNVSVSGSEVAREIIDDIEELGEFLDEISKNTLLLGDKEFLQDRFSSDDGRVATWLRNLADAIEGKK